MWTYIRRNMLAIFRIYTSWEPLFVFTALAAFLLVAALAAWSPFLWDWIVNSDRGGHLQSIILGGVLFMAAVQVFVLGVLADLVAAHRTISQRTLERVRRIELEIGVGPSHYEPGNFELRPPSRPTRTGSVLARGRHTAMGWPLARSPTLRISRCSATWGSRRSPAP